MEIIKKKYNGPIVSRYSFPATNEMKSRLDQLKTEKSYDVNEMFRRFAENLISQATDKDDSVDAEAV